MATSLAIRPFNAHNISQAAPELDSDKCITEGRHRDCKTLDEEQIPTADSYDAPRVFCEHTPKLIYRKTGTSGYGYEGLDRDRQEIRLLRLESQPEPGSKLSLRFTTTCLDEFYSHARYYAVSYAWGDRPGSAKILLDGNECSIPGSADQALRAIYGNLQKAGLDDKTLLWIDALCINQQDLEEKASQVTMMRDIFYQASGVLIWLGYGSGNAKAAFEALAMLADDAAKWKMSLEELMDSTGAPSRDEQASYPNYSAELPDCNWPALRELVLERWFSRLWVLQEIALAEAAHCFYDDQCETWDLIAYGVSWAAHQTWKLPTLSPRNPNFFKMVRAINNLAKRRYIVQTCGLHDVSQFDTVLYYGNFLDTSNPHDKVYAILGLVNTDLLPNYQKPLGDVYKEAMLLAFQESLRPLFLLETCLFHMDPQVDDTRDWPSWIPRLDAPRRYPPLGGILFSSNTAGDEPSQPTLHPTIPDALQLRGVRLGTVVKLYDAPSSPDLPILHPGELEVQKTIYLHFAYLLDFPCLARESYSHSSIAKLAACLVGGSYDDMKVHDNAEAHENMMSNFEAFLREMADANHAADANVSAKLESKQSSNSLQQDAAEDFMMEMTSSFRYPLLRISDRWYGFGTARVSEGDIICLPFGAFDPWVLRKHGDHWKIRGVCYVQGVLRVSCLVKSYCALAMGYGLWLILFTKGRVYS